MGKKRTLAIILLLCVLGGLIACGRKEKEDEYTYTIKLNDNASGSKQFSSCGYLWVYSVTDQMFTKYGNGEMPSSWTVGDTYIFFTTFFQTTKPPAKILSYVRGILFHWIKSLCEQQT